MLFNVPQYIDIEDKIAGPFTWKQLLWLFALGGALLIMWSLMSRIVFFIAAAPVAIAFLALTFYKPHGQPLIRYVFFAILFIFKPKIYFWRRIPEPIRKMSQQPKEEIKAPTVESKKLEAQDLEMIARTLDTGGRERNERIMELINKNRKGKK
jgi:hypothetical protein